MKKLCILISAVLVMALLLCACGGSAKNSLVGTWTITKDGVTLTMTFNEDKTGSFVALGGVITAGFTYTAENGKLTLTPDEGMEDFIDFNVTAYSVDGDSLTLTTDDEPLVFTRQK
ncbi:MAG: hypothetical protein E7563_02590 [Ruminococcaceae bacterium]|nr:hypothetical protein [Oscillospiraceae bacterium]